MNFFGIIIFFALLVHFLLNLLASYLNIKSFHKNIPNGFENYFDEKKYKKSQEYILTNSKFEIITDLFSFALFLFFWFCRGFSVLDEIIRNFQFGPVVSGLIYIGVLLGGKALLDTPFSLYKIFVIEENFGFNKTSLKLYFLDKIKVFFIASVIGIPIVSLILLFFEYSGGLSWLWCWLGLAFFILIMQIVFPVWIMPLFNKFTPLEDGELKSKVMKFAQENDFPLQNVFVMDGSKRSGKSNAFFAGIGKAKRLVLFDTIIKNHTTDEILSIIAHETGHYKKKHILFTTFMGIIQMGIMFYILSVFISHKGLFDAFYMQNISVYAGLVFFGFLYAPVDFFVGLGMLILSRKNEYEADRFAVESTGNKEGFANALKKLSADNYSNLSPHPFYVFLHYSHPPVKDRIKEIMEI